MRHGRAYEEQAAALIEGGVDVLLIETAQDLLQAKAGHDRRAGCDAEARASAAGDRCK
jgi:methionine synthase I (cobalamin-dependent)